MKIFALATLQCCHFPVPTFFSTVIFQYRHFPVLAFSSTDIFQYRNFPALAFSSIDIFHFPVPAFAVPAFSRTSLLSSQAGIAAPTLTVMQGFEAKKDSFVHLLPSSCILYLTCTTQLRIEPGCGGLTAEHANHYTAQLAAMQGQNVVLKPNV